MRKRPRKPDVVEEPDKELLKIRPIVAAALAIAAGVLRPCKKHKNNVLRVEDADIQGAFEVADKAFASGELDWLFASRDELTASMMAAMVDHQATRCELCKPRPPH